MNQKPKILIADDEPIGRQLLQAILMPMDYNLIFAEDGGKALKLAIQETPDLVLLDIMMPELNGYEVCQKIRNDQNVSRVPVLMITALDDRDSRIKGLEAGANDYISKPYDRNEIIAKIKNFLMFENQPSAQNSVKAAASKNEGDLPVHILHKLSSTSPLTIDKLIKHHYFISSKNSIFNVQQFENKIFFSICNHFTDDISGSLFTLGFNRIVHENEINDINNLVYSTFELLGQAYAISPNNFFTEGKLNFVAGIFNKETEIVQLTGFNFYIVGLEENNFKIVEFNKVPSSSTIPIELKGSGIR
ncbi:MAG: response regulator [Bacteroidales bacterium]|nr:response regulator [Bacteroidales bacterium]